MAAPAAKPAKAAKPAAKPGRQPSPLVIKLQIAGAVFVPMGLLGLWLNSKGFFG
ncbi:MAG: hypothetical protein R6W06_08045 [Prochlorococcaceae cyanobacterium]